MVAKMLKLEDRVGIMKFNAPLVVAAPTYNIIDELKEDGDWDGLQKYSGLNLMMKPKDTAKRNYENILYLERLL